MTQQAMMRKLMKMKQEMEETQKEIAESEYEVSSGGIVTVTALGTKELIKIEISEDFEAESKEDMELLADSIVAACKKIYKEIDKIDIEPIGLVTVLLNNFRNIIKIQLANNPTAESCGMKPNQFWAIKHSCGLYTKEQLLSIFNFLTEIDKKIKTGMIPVDSFLIDYIVINILTRR